GVIGFAVTSFGVQAALALTNEAILSSAPPERAGNASGIGETGANLGEALGVAVAGSVAAAVYRANLSSGVLPGGIGPDAVRAARAPLGGAAEAATRLPGRLGDDLLALARAAFTDGMHIAALVNIGILVALTAAHLTLLRPPVTSARGDCRPHPAR